MAQRVQVLLVCDLHEEEVEGTETVTFGLDGGTYEIDLCDDHAAELREDLAAYVGAARRAGRAGMPAQKRSGGGRKAGSGGGSTSSGNVNEIREWARANGYEVSERGRIAGKVLEAYEAAH